MMRKLLLLGAFGLVTFPSCKHIEPVESQEKGIGKPLDKGVPVSFVSDLPATVAYEFLKNIPFLADASNPDGKPGSIKNLPISIKCEDRGHAEQRCRLTYSGQEIRLDLASFLFRTMVGSVYVRKGCDSENCANKPVQIWLKSRAFQGSAGKTSYEIKICRIDGMEVSLRNETPFKFLSQIPGPWKYSPIIKGFSATVEEYSLDQPQYDDYGKQLLDTNGKPVVGSGVAYRVSSAYAGVGPFGPFPSSDCYLQSDNEPKLASPGTLAESSGRLPDAMLADAPAKLAKFAADALQHFTAESRGEPLNFTLRCLNRLDNPTCHLKYRGPSLTIPLPSYITGIFSAEVGMLRRCTNPGCRSLDEAEVQFRAFNKNGLDTLEVCKMAGFEIANYKKFPLQDKLFGLPDLTGATIEINAENPNAPSLKGFYFGLHDFGKYPTPNCQI